MATAIALPRIGPADHNRPMRPDQFDAAIFTPGYKYELITGGVYVTYEPDPPEDILSNWLEDALKRYSARHPRVINYVTQKARVYVPSLTSDTVPEPDLSAYRSFPKRLPFRKIRWKDVSPILVAEIVSPNDPHKDYIRNVELYRQVTSIREYWIVDGSVDADRPTMQVYRRHGSAWRRLELGFRDTYTTRLLPGFKLLIDPRK